MASEGTLHPWLRITPAIMRVLARDQYEYEVYNSMYSSEMVRVCTVYIHDCDVHYITHPRSYHDEDAVCDGYDISTGRYLEHVHYASRAHYINSDSSRDCSYSLVAKKLIPLCEFLYEFLLGEV